MPDTYTLYKLIILYTLNEAGFPITNAQMTEFVLNKGYTTYFVLQEVIGELIDAELILPMKHSDRTEYTITEEGRVTIQYFGDRISEAIRSDIRAFLRDKGCVMKNEAAVTADYYKTTAHEYAVRCRVREKGSDLIDMTITVPTEVQAEATAIKWKTKHQELYAHIMKELL